MDFSYFSVETQLGVSRTINCIDEPLDPADGDKFFGFWCFKKQKYLFSSSCKFL